MGAEERATREGRLASQRSELWAWGADACGQLGLGECAGETLPRQLRYSVRVEAAACGGAHTLLLSELGYVYAMGDNAEGQLGLVG